MSTMDRAGRPGYGLDTASSARSRTRHANRWGRHCMFARRPPPDGLSIMRTFTSSHRSDANHAVNDLFDHGADLVEAAAAIHAAAADPAAARAAPAIMGCLETALHELAGATAALEGVMCTGRAPSMTAIPAGRLGRMRQGFTNAEVALHDAADAAGAARGLAARALDRPVPTRRSSR